MHAPPNLNTVSLTRIIINYYYNYCYYYYYKRANIRLK